MLNNQQLRKACLDVKTHLGRQQQDWLMEALATPISTEALDAYVADAVELEQTARQQTEALLHKQAETISVLTRQRDLAVELLKVCRGVGSINEEKRMNFLNGETGL